VSNPGQNGGNESTTVWNHSENTEGKRVGPAGAASPGRGARGTREVQRSEQHDGIATDFQPSFIVPSRGESGERDTSAKPFRLKNLFHKYINVKKICSSGTEKSEKASEPANS